MISMAISVYITVIDGWRGVGKPQIIPGRGIGDALLKVRLEALPLESVISDLLGPYVVR